MVCLYGQTYPSDSLQRRMLDDERLFLSRMPTDRQHTISFITHRPAVVEYCDEVLRL